MQVLNLLLRRAAARPEGITGYGFIVNLKNIHGTSRALGISNESE